MYLKLFVGFVNYLVIPPGYKLFFPLYIPDIQNSATIYLSSGCWVNNLPDWLTSAFSSIIYDSRIYNIPILAMDFFFF